MSNIVAVCGVILCIYGAVTSDAQSTASSVAVTSITVDITTTDIPSQTMTLSAFVNFNYYSCDIDLSPLGTHICDESNLSVTTSDCMNNEPYISVQGSGAVTGTIDLSSIQIQASNGNYFGIGNYSYTAPEVQYIFIDLSQPNQLKTTANAKIRNSTTCNLASSLQELDGYQTVSNGIAWVKVASCEERYGPFSFDSVPPINDWETFIYFAPFAISLKFMPKNGGGSAYELETVKCSNPIFNLNHGYAIDYVTDEYSELVTGFQDTDDWIGSATALDRVRNWCYHTGIGQYPHLLSDGYLKLNCNNMHGLGILYGALCAWDHSNDTGQDMDIYLGFGWNLQSQCILDDSGNYMHLNSSFYEIILRQTDVYLTQNLFNLSVKQTYLENEYNSNANTFTNIGALNPSDYVASDGAYYFKLLYDQNVTLIWKQTSWLTSPNITGFEPISLTPNQTTSYENVKFKGLGLSPNANSLLDGNAHGSSWWNAVGVIEKGIYESGAPAYNGMLTNNSVLFICPQYFSCAKAPPTTEPTAQPTQQPTASPTQAPSSAPSQAPSSPPSQAPSSAPSQAPSLAPSFTPSHAPSSAPSFAPSHAPSLAPSLTPSHAPSFAPSHAPSFAPSHAPSLAPSLAPSACVDYFNYSSLDGKDIIYEIHPDRDISYQNHSDSSSNITIQKHISTEVDGGFFDKSIVCNNYNSDEDTCFIGCYERGDCALADIQCASAVDTEWKAVKIVCSDTKSCKALVVNLTDTKVSALSLVCNEAFACEESQLTIDISSLINISIDCNALFSCKDINIDLVGNKKMNVSVMCNDDYSCDNMVINTEHSPHIFIYLYALRYSKDITIFHHLWRNINVNCGNADDRRYIRYDTHYLLDEYEVLQLAREEYDARKLPCEDIHVLCSNNTHFDRECEYKYGLTDVSLSDILMDEDKPNCYWLEIGHLYKVQCEGTCDDRAAYKTYNKSFDLDIIFGGNDDENDNEQRRLQTDEEEDDSHQNSTKSFRICDEYFGSENVTRDSLSSIDAVFDHVFDLMISIDNFLIHSILLPPETMLRDGLFVIECKNEEQNIIGIKTNVTIESAEYREKMIDDIFDTDGVFIRESTELLSQLFGIPITIKSFDTITNKIEKGIDELVVIIIICGALCVILTVLLLVFKAHKKRKADKEALTTYVKNAMVLFIGIAEYDASPNNPQVDGYFQNLGGIDVDSRNVNKLFGDTLNYNVSPNQLKLHWTLSEIMQFLNERAAVLETNVNTVYDGLVVIMSCHGVTDYVVTSDYKKIKRSAVHRIFTSERPKNRQIPRLFLFDCCDGEDAREVGVFRDEYEGMSDDETTTNSTKCEQNKAAVEEETNDATEAEQVPLEPESLQPPKDKKLKRTYSKNVELATVSGRAGAWLHDEDNPDFRLVEIRAANEGFQSKLDTVKGSFVITAFVERMTQNIETNHNEKWLFEICGDIQDELHRLGKQHTVNIFNDNMNYLKFVKAPNENNKVMINTLAVDSGTDRDDEGLSVLSDGSQAKGRPSTQVARDQKQRSLKNEVKQFLGTVNADEYYGEFERNGYKTLQSLQLMDEEIFKSKFTIEPTVYGEILKAIKLLDDT